METIEIEIKNKNALSILKGLKKTKIIKLIKPKNKGKNTPVHHKGAITQERAVELIKEIEYNTL
jgi:hypothetical protein